MSRTKTLAIAILALSVMTAPALAFQCPILIKQLNDQVAKLDANSPKVKQAKVLIEEAQKLHSSGNHASSVAKADEAAKVLGVELKKN